MDHRKSDSGGLDKRSTRISVGDRLYGFVNRRSPVQSRALAQGSRYLESFAKKLDAKVDSSGGPDACWPWTGGRTHDGYGRLFSDNSQVLAHVAALEVKLRRRLRPGEHSLHTCDNPPCCNPRHLWPGSKATNSADAVAKGRTLSGERNPAAKVSERSAALIRAACAPGKYRRGLYSELARRLRISSRQVSYIAKGERRAQEVRA